MTFDQDLISELDSNWNNTVMPKPTMFGKAYGKGLPVKKFPTLQILVSKKGKIPLDFGNDTDMTAHPFTITGKSKSQQDITDMDSEIDRILKAMSIDSGWVQIDSTDDFVFDKAIQLEVIGRKIQIE